MGELIRVLPGTYVEGLEPDRLRALVEGPTLAWTFFVLQRALDEGEVVRVTSLPVPEHARRFPLFRAGLPDRKTRRVELWVLWDGEKQWPAGTLTPEQQRLPVRRLIPTADVLARKITAGWPERS